MNELIILGNMGNPELCITKGHISRYDFAKLLSENGFAITDKTKISFEYWKQHEDRAWQKTNKSNLKAQEVTVARW